MRRGATPAFSRAVTSTIGPQLIQPNRSLGGLVQSAAAYTGSACSQCAGTGARVALSDRSTLGGLTQFATQFGFRARPLARKQLILKTRRDVRVVEGARLESVCTGNRTEGSNPSLSAIPK